MKKSGLFIMATVFALTFGGLTQNALAAEGWVQSGTNWVYYDANGYKVTDSWKKGADNLWRYLNGNGDMTLNSWVDNTYYVDANGVLVADKFMKLPNPGGGSSEEYKWYYFGSSGKIITDVWKKIDNKWYYFDVDGAMLTGWILDNMYYCGADGVMRTGWQRLTPPNDGDQVTNAPMVDEDDGKNWYYFGTNGKKYIPELAATDFEIKKIDGSYYCFDSEGAMQTGWKNVGAADVDYEIENYKYFTKTGTAQTGWLSMTPPEDLKDYEGDVEWFYFSSNGTPKAGPKEGQASTNDLYKIGGLTYLFNDKGNPVYGLQRLRISNSEDTYTSYYFGPKKTSTVMKGKQKIEEGDGTLTDFYFSDSGRGYTGVKDGYLYYMGKVQKAEEGMRYTVFSLPTGNSHTNYVVNMYGKVAKSSTVKDADGVKYKTGSTGNLIEVDDAAPAGSYRAPVEPIWSYQ